MVKKRKIYLIALITLVMCITTFFGFSTMNAYAFSGTNSSLTEQELYNATNTYKFSCRKGAIDDLTSSSNWYSQQDILSAISTEVYFEDIDEYTTFYYGERDMLVVLKKKSKFL